MTEVDSSSPERGLQPERTVLAWTRTALSVVASGVLILLRERGSTTDLNGCTARLWVGAATAVMALAVFAVGVLRRRALEVRPLPERVRAQAAVLLVGMAVVALALIVTSYLVLRT